MGLERSCIDLGDADAFASSLRLPATPLSHTRCWLASASRAARATIASRSATIASRSATIASRSAQLQVVALQLNVAALAEISAELGEAGRRGEGGVVGAGALTSTGDDGSARIESHGTFGAAALLPSLGGGRPAEPLLKGKKEKKKRARVEDDGLGRNGTVRSCVGDRLAT